ncbi:MAG: branched-chain amino acid ABC transporter permease [Desulfarculus sp.]|nr:MAG: branched-chain amino acid ABC transporter permease [Desulfarculus sp.]
MQLDSLNIIAAHWKFRAAVAGCVGLLVFWPMVSRVVPLSVPLMCEILIFGLFAMGFNIALGYTGVMSLGHAAFFGVGAYTTGICLKLYGWPLEVSMLAGVTAAVLAGMLVAILAFQATGAYRLIITLAMSMVFYYISQVWVSLTGGHDGLTGIPTLKLTLGVTLTNNLINKYYFILAIFLICIYLLWRLVNSPFGKAMVAVRENEQRSQTCGYNTYWIMWWSFVISALFSGVAGALFLVFLEFCDVYILYWLMSGTVLVITLFGGTRVFLGPFVGALVFTLMRDNLSLYIEHWEVFTGLFFVAIVLFLPKGILGSLMDKLRPKASRPAADPATSITEEQVQR